MGTLRLIPEMGEVFTDARGEGRTLRVSWHEGPGVVVVSLWAGGLCRGSFRLPASDVPRLKSLLDGIGDAASDAEAEGDGASGSGLAEASPEAAESINVIDNTESTGVIKDTAVATACGATVPTGGTQRNTRRSDEVDLGRTADV